MRTPSSGVVALDIHPVGSMLHAVRSSSDSRLDNVLGPLVSATFGFWQRSNMTHMAVAEFRNTAYGAVPLTPMASTTRR